MILVPTILMGITNLFKEYRMTHFLTKAKEVFPSAQFTGGSSIHASLARNVQMQAPWDQPRLILKSLKHADFPGMIYRLLIKSFPGMEWLMTDEDFSNLLLVDFHRLLEGQGTQETEFRLTNPTTGNKFHRITLIPDQDIVGGIRVWLMPAGDNLVHIGFRFRMESLYGEGEHKKVRQKAATQVLELEQAVNDLKDYVAQEQGEPVAITMDAV